MLLKHDITERLFYEHPDVYKGCIDIDQINFKNVDRFPMQAEEVKLLENMLYNMDETFAPLYIAPRKKY